MLTIQRSFFSDKKTAIAHGLSIPVACSKVALYQAIAQHLGIAVEGLDLDQLLAAIDERNMELACVGVVDKPVLRRDRKPLPKPILKNTKPVVYDWEIKTTFAKELVAKGLVIVK